MKFTQIYRYIYILWIPSTYLDNFGKHIPFSFCIRHAVGLYQYVRFMAVLAFDHPKAAGKS